ncbi:MAG: DUF3160 domain-containing protein [Roseibacillus sp.]
MAEPTAVDLYYKLWTDNLPVFITADSVFDGWHQSFSYFLEELEKLYLYPKLRSLLAHNPSSSGPSGFSQIFSPPTAVTNGGLVSRISYGPVVRSTLKNLFPGLEAGSNTRWFRLSFSARSVVPTGANTGRLTDSYKV